MKCKILFLTLLVSVVQVVDGSVEWIEDPRERRSVVDYQTRMAFNRLFLLEIEKTNGKFTTEDSGESYDEAIKSLYAILRQDPMHTTALSMAASIHWKLGNLDHADDLYARAGMIGNSPVPGTIPVDGYYLHGLLSLHRQDLDGAKGYLKSLESYESDFSDKLGAKIRLHEEVEQGD